MQIVEILLYLCMFGLLITAIVQDIHTRNIPLWASIPFGLIAITLLTINGDFYIAAYLFLALYMPRNWIGQLILMVAALFLIIMFGLEIILPLILGILFVDLMGRFGWYGGGDLAMIFPLIGLSHDWQFIGWMCGLILLAHFVLNLKRFDFMETVKRTIDVTKNVWKGNKLEDDEMAIRTPAMIVIGIAAFGYFFIYPGIFITNLFRAF